MRSLYLINHPIFFQGEDKLKKGKDYFEGWYFKNTIHENTVSFIPGISISKDRKLAFIQVLTNGTSHFFTFPISQFQYHLSPFWIKIGDNFFSNESIFINICKESLESKKNIKISGELFFRNSTPKKQALLSPNIMGPFSYLPFMECNHAIVSLRHQVNGYLKIQDSIFNFRNGTGYIEKDFGTSFPSSYSWCHANTFEKEDASLFFSHATIPMGPTHFSGFICTFLLKGKEYNFHTYNLARILRYKEKENSLKVVLKRGKYSLLIDAYSFESGPLLAPKLGKMDIPIKESVNATVTIHLFKHRTLLFSGKCSEGGLEIVH